MAWGRKENPRLRPGIREGFGTKKLPVLDHSKELSTYNQQDLFCAKALRATAARQLQSTSVHRLICSDIRALAAAVESAQRIGRLALGASTSNSISGAMPFTDDDNFNPEQLTDEELITFQKLIHKAMRSAKPPGDGTIQ